MDTVVIVVNGVIQGANSLAMHVELAMTKVGLSGLHALKAFL